MEDAEFLNRLRGLIGRDCELHGRRCRLIEVLADEGTLVLEAREDLPPIQPDQYGQALYRGNEVVQVPIFGRDREQLSEELLELLGCIRGCVGEP